MSIQMNRKELNKTFMMIPRWKKNFGWDVFFKLIQRFKGYSAIAVFIIYIHSSALTLWSKDDLVLAITYFVEEFFLSHIFPNSL